MEWAGSFGAGHGDPKARIPLNVSTSTVSLPNFIVIKDPEIVPAPHTSVAHLCGPVFALVPVWSLPCSSKYCVASWGRGNLEMV